MPTAAHHGSTQRILATGMAFERRRGDVHHSPRSTRQIVSAHAALPKQEIVSRHIAAQALAWSLGPLSWPAASVAHA
jgi:hypothetical protein